MKDVMLDLETWGNRHNSVVVQIGACYFNRYTGEIGSTYEVHVDAEDEMASGFDVDASTLYWWMSQSKEAQKMAHGLMHERKSCHSAWHYFNEFLNKAKYIWSHATFDFVIMTNHFHVLGIKPKVLFRGARDIRTLVDLSGVKFGKRTGTHHNALDDCKHQVKYCTKAISNNIGD